MKFNEKELPFDKSVISSYLEKTLENILEPNYDNFINYVQLQQKKFFYNYLYPILSFNFNLYYFYKDIRYLNSFDKHLIKQKCKKTRDFIYHNYIDFSELIKAIKSTRFHSNENLNILFHTKAINYIINSSSLISLFIHSLLDILSLDDNKKKNIINYKFKIKVSNLQQKFSPKKENYKNINEYYLKPKYDIIIDNPFFQQKIIQTKTLNLKKYNNKLPIIKKELNDYKLKKTEILNKKQSNVDNINTNINKDYDILNFDDNYEFKSINSNEKKIPPNIFDSLFTIRKIEKYNELPEFYKRERYFYCIDVKINDISKLLEPYLEKHKFEYFLFYNENYNKINEYPENFIKLLDLDKYPFFHYYKKYDNN